MAMVLTMVVNGIYTIWGLMEQRLNSVFDVVASSFRSFTMALAFCYDNIMYSHPTDSTINTLLAWSLCVLSFLSLVLLLCSICISLTKHLPPWCCYLLVINIYISANFFLYYASDSYVISCIFFSNKLVKVCRVLVRLFKAKNLVMILNKLDDCDWKALDDFGFWVCKSQKACLMSLSIKIMWANAKVRDFTLSWD